MNFQELIKAVSETHHSLKTSAAKAINRLLTLRNWVIGFYIIEYEQNGVDKARYGDKLLFRLANELQQGNLSNINERELRRYRSFYLTYPQFYSALISNSPEIRIWGTLSPKLQEQSIRETVFPELKTKQLFIPPEKLINRLSFSHFAELITLDDPLKRTYYELECIKGNWSVRELRRQINSLYFERSGISKDPAKLSALIENKSEKQEPRDLIKNIYAFEFLGLPLKDAVEETSFEKALLDHLEEFLIELGYGFCLEGRQKRILIGDRYYFVDLVFYHRILKCHVLVDLKVEEFSHADAGQLNTYLNYFKQEIQQPDDNPPVGILLVTNKNDALVKFATAGMNENLFVQKYMLNFPSKSRIEDYIRQELNLLK
jgi:predicted nuclease of restriction endonuclease-like (RecB) superfamily